MNKSKLIILLPLLLLLLAPPMRSLAAEAEAVLPKNSLEPHEIGVIANASAPDSMRAAKYYMKVRGIPEENLAHVTFDAGRNTISAGKFRRAKMLVDKKLPNHVQALALAWARPFRVDCMSITSAFAFGFSNDYCADGPKLTKPNPFFTSESHAPYNDFGIRPAMMLAGRNFQEVKKLIDRGVASDSTRPDGTAYLVQTGDKARDVRSPFYAKIIEALSGVLNIEHHKTPGIRGRKDVMFYFTGAQRVPHLETLEFLPGAAADHLTSGGGRLFGGGQMSVLDWLEAGAAGSYGTVVEPYNITAKFPHPGVLVDRYTRGETLIESYWKSVAMPGQGVFVGEPLARPYGGSEVELDDGVLTIRTMALDPGFYRIHWSKDGLPPYSPIQNRVTVLRGMSDIEVHGAPPGFYFVEKLSGD